MYKQIELEDVKRLFRVSGYGEEPWAPHFTMEMSPSEKYNSLLMELFYTVVLNDKARNLAIKVLADFVLEKEKYKGETGNHAYILKLRDAFDREKIPGNDFSSTSSENTAIRTIEREYSRMPIVLIIGSSRKGEFNDLLILSTMDGSVYKTYECSINDDFSQLNMKDPLYIRPGKYPYMFLPMRYKEGNKEEVVGISQNSEAGNISLHDKDTDGIALAGNFHISILKSNVWKDSLTKSHIPLVHFRNDMENDDAVDTLKKHASKYDNINNASVITGNSHTSIGNSHTSIGNSHTSIGNSHTITVNGITARFLSPLSCFDLIIANERDFSIPDLDI